MNTSPDTLEFTLTEIAQYINETSVLKLDQIHQKLRELISEFNQWKSHLVTNPELMGGEAVFPNSRLSVRHIGTILEKGESQDVILEDYPYLTLKDLQFANLYIKAYPTIEQPKKA